MTIERNFNADMLMDEISVPDGFVAVVYRENWNTELITVCTFDEAEKLYPENRSVMGDADTGICWETGSVLVDCIQHDIALSDEEKPF